jgi:hypothetical protein
MSDRHFAGFSSLLQSHTFKVPEPEKEEVLTAFAAHKGEGTEGYL